MRPMICALCVSTIAAVAIACGGDAPDAPVDVFQIASVSAGPSSVSCVRGTYPYQLRVNVKLVNTTDQDIPIVKVRSSGVVIRGTYYGDVGQYVHVQDSVGFVPLTMHAHDASGTKTLEVTLDAQCGNPASESAHQVCVNNFCHIEGGSSGAAYRDVQTTFYVRTPYGEYAAPAVVTHLAFAN